MKTSRFIAGFVACCALASCSIDDRRLQTAGGAEAGSSSDGGAPHGGSSSTGSAGKSGISGSNSHAGTPALAEGGAGGQPEVPLAQVPTVDGCADLDEDGVGDCQQTLLTNASFKTDVSHWHADSGASLTWDPRDALGAPDSGSALLAAASSVVDAGGSSLATAGQCVAVSSGQVVIAYANALVDEGQDAGGQASINVDFYDSADCTGTSTHGFSTPQPLDALPGSWLTLKAGLPTHAGTHSVRVMLAIEKPFQAPAFHARFDNVLLKTQPAN